MTRTILNNHSSTSLLLEVYKHQQHLDIGIHHDKQIKMQLKYSRLNWSTKAYPQMVIEYFLCCKCGGLHGGACTMALCDATPYASSTFQTPQRGDIKPHRQDTLANQHH
jgi:hypothetical protein